MASKTTKKPFKIRRRLFKFDDSKQKPKPTKNRIKKRYIILILVIITLVVGGYLGYNSYQNWLDNREKVANYINQNTDIYNQTSQSSQEIVLTLNSLVQFDQEKPDEVKEQLTQIQEKITKIEGVVASIDTNKEALIEPPVEDANEVQQKFEDSLSSKKATLFGLEDFLNYQVCLISSSNQQSTSLDQFKVNIEGFTNASDTTSLEDKLQFVNSAKEKINTNIDINNNLPKCFEGRYARYYTNKIQTDINSDTQLYQQYITSLDELSEGLKATDSPRVQSATDNLVQLASQAPVFYTSEQFKSAIEKPTEEIRVQAEALEKQEELLSREINNLKAQYLL